MANRYDLVKALRFRLVNQGHELSVRDNQHFSWCIRIFICVCLDLEYYQPISPKRIVRSMANIVDIDKLVRFQDHLLSFLRRNEPLDEKVVEEACLGFILPTARAFRKHHRIRYFRTLNVVAQFLKNVNLKDLQTEDLEAFASFQGNPIEFDEGIAEEASKILPDIALNFECDTWKFGPGASYEVSRHAGSGPKAKYISTQPCNWRTYRLLASMGYQHRTRPEFGSLTSRAIAVPKSVKKRRVITCEPTFATMASQRLRSALIRYAKEADLQICLETQSLNRQLALAGSANGSFATIDLHAASDSVTIQLVRKLFGRTSLLPYLEDARVSCCEIEGKSVTLQSYAGMGNAVTFILESIVFAVIVEYVRRRHFPNDGKLYIVYGDDIVVPTKWAKRVMDTLEALGFVPNRLKSFYSSYPFRESCGIEAFSGHIVTPVRISRKAYFDGTNSMVESYIALSNNLYDAGLHTAASAVRRWFHLKDRGIPYTDDPNGYGLYIWDYPENAHLKHRYNRYLQREEVLVRDFSPRSTNGSDDDRYTIWLMRHSTSGDKIPWYLIPYSLPDIPEKVRVGSPIAMPRNRWMPVA